MLNKYKHSKKRYAVTESAEATNNRFRPPKAKGVQLLGTVCKITMCGASLVVQRLRLHAPNAGGEGLIPGWGAKMSHAAGHCQKINN